MEINFFTSPSILIVFIVFIVILHFIFIKVFPLNKSQWLKMEYLILSFGAVGIITATADVRGIVAPTYYDLEQHRTDTMYAILLQSLDAPTACINHIKTQDSPSNFEEIQKEYDNICKWEQGLKQKLPHSASPDYPSLRFSDYKPNFSLTNKIIISEVNLIKERINFYQAEREKMLFYKSEIVKSDFEQVFYFLSPIFIAFALALQVTKVTADRKELK